MYYEKKSCVYVRKRRVYKVKMFVYNVSVKYKSKK